MRIPIKETVVLLIGAAGMMISCKQPEHADKEIVTELPFHEVDLADDKSFGELKNWKLAGNVIMNCKDDRQIEQRDGETLLVSEAGEKGLLMLNWDHENCDVKLDFMLSKGSAVSVLFQGRYKIELKDDWNGKGTSRCGAVSVGPDSVVSPALNACKAPGLWQHLYVKFHAPQVDASGKKTSNASFQEIYLNGTRIHSSIQLGGPARDALFTDDNQKKPLVVITDVAPVAIRNVQYKSYTKDKIDISDLTFSVYKGLYKEYDTLKKMEPLRKGEADSLHWVVGDKRAQLVISGKMNIPVEGDYLFNIRAGGPAWLLIDLKEVVDNHGTREYTKPFYGKVSLKKGEHTFQIIYANYDESLVVEYEGPDIAFTRLTSPSAERFPRQAPPMEYVVGKEPGVQRGFFTHRGKVNTYTMAVGAPGGPNYAYDLSTYNILSTWRGKFIDVSNMWEERGESQMEIPLGAQLEFPGVPPFLKLANEQDAWTDTVEVDNNIYNKRGYRLSDAGLPVFFYTYKEANVQDELLPANDQAGLMRKVTITFTKSASDFYFLLGRGKLVEKLPQGGYAMDDKEYYIESMEGIDEKQLAIVKAENDGYELLLPVSGKGGTSVSFGYTIVW